MLLPPDPLPAQQSYGGLVTGLAFNFSIICGTQSQKDAIALV
jgi:hypothetical protein